MKDTIAVHDEQTDTLFCRSCHLEQDCSGDCTSLTEAMTLEIRPRPVHCDVCGRQLVGEETP